MVNKKLFYCFIVILLLGIFVFAFSANIAFAADPIIDAAPTGEINCDKTSTTYNPNNAEYCGDYELNDMVGKIIRVSEIILGLVGSLALLFFIYGGVMFLISSGSQERVTQAKQIIVGAVIGIVIVFTSYMIINFVAGALGITVEGGILQSGWLE